MTVSVVSYTIYHSVNAYLGTVLLRRALAELPGVELIRRPIYVPRRRGILVAEMLGGRENRNVGAYNREDCRRWADRFAIPLHYPPPDTFVERAERWKLMPYAREELAARAFYAAATAQRDALDQALFEAAWVSGLDINEPEVIRSVAARTGSDGAQLLAAAAASQAGDEARAAVEDFDRLGCPGVPTFPVAGELYFGKDRIDWVVARCREFIAATTPPASAQGREE